MKSLNAYGTRRRCAHQVRTESCLRWPTHSLLAPWKLIQVTIMRKQRHYSKGSWIPISLESVRIQFGIGLQYLPLGSHTPDRSPSGTRNIPKCQFLGSVTPSALLPLVKN